MEQVHKDTYFLNRDIAYQTALAHHVVVLENGQKKLQLCYYDGERFLHAPKNLIHVPINSFSEFFKAKQLRLPQHFNTNHTQLSEYTKREIFKKLRSVVCTIEESGLNRN